MYIEIQTFPKMVKKDHNLSVKVPTFFRCPISLDVMKSPVSLCTGVTYDRSSIQRWIDSGNNTCPATMQPLPSTDLIPNLTLHRLINLWCSAAAVPTEEPILDRIASSADPSADLDRLFLLIADETVDDFEKSNIVTARGGAKILVTKLSSATSISVMEKIITIVEKVFAIFAEDDASWKTMVSALTTSGTSASPLIRVLKESNSLDARKNAARVLDIIIRNGSSKEMMAEKSELLSELIRLVSEEPTCEPAISCLVALSEVRRARVPMVQLGIVSLSTRILEGKSTTASAAEKALKLLEMASGCADGREEICELGDKCIGAILGKMMKVGKLGTESAVAVLWSVCHLYRDRRAQEAVAASNGGLTRILLLMQSNCSAATRQMTGDLLKIFRVNSKSCLSGYDTKTTHIMPF